MAELKNPFGLRDGKVIMIADLGTDERGLACDCVCPLCHDHFEARLGSKRVHHFAHNGTGCDQLSAYLLGLYSVLKEYLLSGAAFPVPELGISYPGGLIPLSNEKGVKSGRYFYGRNAGLKYSKVCQAFSKCFDNCEIISSEKTKCPTALIAHYKERRLAFVIKPPNTVCKDFEVKPFGDIATLKLDLTPYGNSIANSTTKEMQRIFCMDGICSWLYSPSVKSEIDKINEDRATQKAEQERLQEEARKRQEEIRRRRAEEQRKEAEERQKRAEEQRLREELRRQEATAQEEQKNRELDQQKRDSGTHWERPVRTCACCRQRKDYEDVIFGKKTRRFYCFECLGKKLVYYREI